ncbi:hypothetical protein HC766_08200 [Candidatus Gracilibacteria bacterium]|nr:hypothetical protein [Candidatus Gracilibacteria bacterium]
MLSFQLHWLWTRKLTKLYLLCLLEGIFSVKALALASLAISTTAITTGIIPVKIASVETQEEASAKVVNSGLRTCSSYDKAIGNCYYITSVVWTWNYNTALKLVNGEIFIKQQKDQVFHTCLLFVTHID